MNALLRSTRGAACSSLVLGDPTSRARSASWLLSNVSAQIRLTLAMSLFAARLMTTSWCTAHADASRDALRGRLQLATNRLAIDGECKLCYLGRTVAHMKHPDTLATCCDILPAGMQSVSNTT